MCQSMVDIQPAAGEIRRGKKKKERKIDRKKLQGKNIMAPLLHRAAIIIECGPMSNVMVALPNIGGALCSTPQSLADAYYFTAVQ